MSKVRTMPDRNQQHQRQEEFQPETNTPPRKQPAGQPNECERPGALLKR